DLGYHAAALESPLPKMRRQALRRIAVKRDWALAALPRLVKALDDPDPTVRPCAVEAVGTVGPRAECAVPRLIQLLGSAVKDQDVNVYLIDALREIGPVAVPELVNTAQKSKNSLTRLMAILVLDKLSDESKAARQALFAALTDKDKEVRKAAV